jgi:hypothetical protein
MGLKKDTLRDKASKKLKQLWEIYNEYGIYEFNGKYYDRYHDAMLTQCQGANIDFNEATSYVEDGFDADEEWEYVLQNYDKALKVMRIMRDAHRSISKVYDSLVYC